MQGSLTVIPGISWWYVEFKNKLLSQNLQYNFCLAELLWHFSIIVKGTRSCWNVCLQCVIYFYLILFHTTLQISLMYTHYWPTTLYVGQCLFIWMEWVFPVVPVAHNCCHQFSFILIARFMGPTWGPFGHDRTLVGSMLAPWILLSGII